MHIKNMHTMIEELTACTKEAIENNEKCVGVFAIPDVIDMIKDLCAAEYHARIAKSMGKADEEESEAEKYMLKQLVSEYGEDDGRRYYDNYRYANGRFAPRGRGKYTRRGYEEPPYYHAEPTYRMTTEDYREWERNRDMDKYRGKLYFSEPITADGMRHSPTGTYTESRYDARKRAYTETKEMHKANTPEDKQARMKDLEAYIQELSSDVNEIIKDMTPEEKQLAKQKVTMLASKM